MLGLRATRAARLPCPYPPCSAAQAASLSGLARRAPLLAVASPAPSSPAALSLLASARPVSAAWGSAMRPAGEHPRPCTRVLCTAASSSAPREGKEVLVQHLLVGEKDARLLVDLEKSIASGVDLSDLAVEHSLCPSKENGGMLGWVRRGQMVPEFEEAAFSAPLNKVVRCKTKFGWHLVQVLSERDQCLLQDIQPEELHAKMQDPSFIEEAQLIDVREPDEVERASLPGFKVLPLRQFGTWGPVMTDEFNPQKDTYVLCHHGMRSMQVAKWLQSQGFQKIYNVAGGIHAYSCHHGMRSMQVAKWLQSQGFQKIYNVAGGIHAYSVKADSSIPTY